ncbi:retrovirus-related pol polyprotein from transposon TNT 1-94 [Tanacetum coccineum]
MTGDRSRLRNFMKKFTGIVRFGNDHFGAIMGYGDYVIGDSVISRVYYVEGLGHNLFSVRQFCDSDLEVAFRKHSCYVRDTDGVELIKGSRGSNLYTISVEDMMKSSPICLLSKASKNKSWLWHRRLNHLNFGTINDLARKDLVRGLPRLKFEKDHLCSACQLGKSKKHTHKPKIENTNLEVLNTLHMDLCGPMRVQMINGKKYILVIVDDYSRFTWVKFLRSKDETPEVVIKFLKQIQVGLNKTVRYIRTDNGTEFVNKDLTEYYERVGIFHQKTVLRTPQQNGVVERRNRTLVEAARTMLIFSKAPMFLWAEVVATACYTQNRSLIHTRHNKTPYELVHDKKLDLTFFRVFGALCYPTNDSEDLGKLQPIANIGIFLSEPMAPVQLDTGPAPTFLTLRQISSGLVPNPVTAAPYVPPTNKEMEILFQPMFNEYLEPPRVERLVSPAPAVPDLVNSAGVVAEFTLVEENPFAPVDNDPFINIFAPEPTSKASSSGDVSRTDRPLVFGLRLFKTYDGGSLTGSEFREKVHRDRLDSENDHFLVHHGINWRLLYCCIQKAFIHDEVLPNLLVVQSLQEQIMVVASTFKPLKLRKPFNDLARKDIVRGSDVSKGRSERLSCSSRFQFSFQSLIKNSTGTPSSTTIDQDAPSLSHLPSSSTLQSLNLHQGVAAESTLRENNPCAPVDNDPFINVFAPNRVLKHLSIGNLVQPESLYVHSNTVQPLGNRAKITRWIILLNAVQACKMRFTNLDRLQVWELVPQPNCVIIIALKWIYKVKFDEYGDVLKNKARLVAKGYRQEEVPLLSAAIMSSTLGPSTLTYDTILYESKLKKAWLNYTMADMNVLANDAPAEQAPAIAPPTRTDDQILPLSKWVPIGKSNYLDEQWFNLHKDLLRDALDITPTNDNNPFVAPPSSDTVIEYVNTLGYPCTLRNVSAMSVNALYQPWRVVLSMINMCLTGAPYYNEYLEHVAKYQQHLDAEHGMKDEGGATESPKATKVAKPKAAKVIKPASDKAPKPTSSQPPKPTPAQTEPSKKDQGVPEKEPAHDDKEADLQQALELSLKDQGVRTQGPAHPVVIRETNSGRIQPLPDVQGKGKEKVIDEQAAHDLLTLHTLKQKSHADQFIFQRRTPMPTESSGHAESPSLDVELALTDSETESNEEAPEIHAGDQDEGQAGPNPVEQDEGQAGSNLGDAAESQP